jgi:DNA mismatch repair protein MutS2
MREYLYSFEKLELEKVVRQIQSLTYSDLGKESLRSLRPLSDPEQIRKQLALVTEMKQLLEGDEPLPIHDIVDIREALQRASIEDYVLPSEDLRAVARTLQTAFLTSQFFGRRKGRYPLLDEAMAGFRVDKLLEHHISQAIDEDGHVKDSASRELQNIRRQILEYHDTLRRSLERMLKTFAEKGWAQEEIVTTREGRMVVPIKVEHKNQIPGFIHSSSASGATVFVEPTETLELNNEIRTLQFREQREIEKILRGLTAEVRAAREQILLDVRILGELDVLSAKAKYSIIVIGSAPQVGVSRTLKLVQAYHPLLLQKHRRNEIAPLTMELTEEYRTLIITGPNAGGKSVAMKTVGLLAILAHAGCHIPAGPETLIPFFDEIFVDMGDEQSIEQDLSSFSSHLSNLKLICDHVTASSLVLIDEIASGTDPQEGAALASAILEHLTGLGCLTVVTTHHGMLKTFAFENPAVQNGGMEFNQESLTPTYRFRAGVPGSSYALEMADRMHLPPKILERSRAIKGKESSKLEDLILELEQQSQELRTTIDRARAERAEFEALKVDYQEKRKRLQQELKEAKAQATAEARGIIERANTLVERTVMEIRETAASKESVRTAKKDLRDLQSEYAASEAELGAQEGIPASRPIEVGDAVRIRSTSARGEVASRVDAQTMLVLIGSLKVKVPVQDLELSLEKERKFVYHEPVLTSTEVQREIDLRGLYGDEAIEQIDRFLDSAILSGLSRVDIIHGKGSGALRKRVAEYLKKNPHIKSFRLGEWNEGGGGVTVVEL